MTKSARRVVITGMGAVSPFGVGVDLFWDNIKEGNSGIKRISVLDVTDQPVKIGGDCPDFDASQYVDKKKLKEWTDSLSLVLLLL